MDIPVAVPMTCVITRFRVRRPRHLWATLRDYRRLLRAIENPEKFGLVRWAFAVENLTTCYSLSIWSGEPRMSSNVTRHTDVASRIFPRLAYQPGRGPEIWSTQWRLISTSHNVNWGDFAELLHAPASDAVTADAG